MSEPLLAVRGLSHAYPPRSRVARGAERPAVDGVNLAVAAGECVALVGRSGSGKSTLARLVVRLLDPRAGEIRFAGRDLVPLRGSELRRARRQLQMVFQDPWSSLDPRLRVGASIAEPLSAQGLAVGEAARARVRRLLREVGLEPELADRYPHQMSGGQRQRVAIARALAPEPRLLIADEAVSALDAPVRVEILDLLSRLRTARGLGLLVVSHDLGVVARIAQRVLVMEAGRLVEEGSVRDVLAAPRHRATRALVDARPRLPASAGGGNISPPSA